MNNKYSFCKYCHQKMEEFDCSELSNKKQKTSFFEKILNFWFWIEIPFSSLYDYLFNRAEDKKLERNNKINTCINSDCIGYLDGCFDVNS